MNARDLATHIRLAIDDAEKLCHQPGTNSRANVRALALLWAAYDEVAPISSEGPRVAESRP